MELVQIKGVQMRGALLMPDIETKHSKQHCMCICCYVCNITVTNENTIAVDWWSAVMYGNLEIVEQVLSDTQMANPSFRPNQFDSEVCVYSKLHSKTTKILMCPGKYCFALCLQTTQFSYCEIFSG